MGEHQHPRYLFKHPGGAAVPPHELFLQPRADSDYGLRTKSLSPEGDDCMVRDEHGHVIHWKHKVRHNDWVEFRYPFKVYVECPDGHTENLITCEGTEMLKAVPIAMPLHEDLELRLSSMVHEANLILDSARGSEHEKNLLRQEVEAAMAENFDDEAIEEMTKGTFFRYFVATHETHGGVRVLLKFMHIVQYDEHDVATTFSLKFRAAKVLVPHGEEFGSFFRHEKTLGSLTLQCNIMRTCVNGAYTLAAEMQERRTKSAEEGDGADADSDAQVPEDSTGGDGSERIQGIGSTLKGAAKSVGSAFSSAGKKVGKVASRAGRAVGKRAASVARAAGSGLRSVAFSASVKAGFALYGASRAASRVRTAASSAAGKIRSGASSVYTGAKTALGSAAGRVRDAASSAGRSVRTTVGSLRDRVKTQFTSIKDKVSTKANAVKDAVGRRFESVKTSVGKARDGIRDKYTSVKQSVRDRVSKIRGKNTTGSASSAPSGTSSNAPQDKIVSSSSPNSDKPTAAGAASPGDARAPVGSGGQRQADRKDLPPTPSQKAAAAAAKDSSVFDKKQAPPPAPKNASAAAAVYKPPQDKPKRHGEGDAKPSAPVGKAAKADDGLGSYRNAPSAPASKASAEANKFPSGPAPKPPSSSSSSSSASTSGARVEINHNGTPGSTSTAKVSNADGTTDTVVAKTRADGSTKVTTTRTGADGRVISKDKKEAPRSSTNAQNEPKGSSNSSDTKKEPKEKKQSTLSKLKEKVTSKSPSSSDKTPSSSSGGSAPQNGGDSGSADSVAPSADLAGTRPDYDRDMRDQDRQQANQDRQASEEDLKDVRPYEFRGDPRGNVAGAALAGAVTGAVVAGAYQQQQQQPVLMAGGVPPGGIYGAPSAQTLPPGYAMTANGIMAVGPDGRLYPLTPQQYAEVQLYQQRQQGLAPVGAPPMNTVNQPDSSTTASTSPNPSISSYKPNYSVRLADDDELVGGGASTKPVSSTSRDDQPVNDEMAEAAEAGRRDALYKFMLAEHAASFGKTPTKVQKDKLWARLSNTKPLVIKKIFSTYVEWLTNDTGLRYA